MEAIVSQSYEEIVERYPVDIAKARRQNSGDKGHEPPAIGEQVHGEDAVTAKEDRMEAAITAIAESSALVAHAVALQSSKNGKPSIVTYVTGGVACIALLFSASNVRFQPTGEGEMRQQIELAKQTITSLNIQLAEARDDIKSLRAYNDNTRVQFAVHGWSIDPETGRLSKNKNK